MRKRERNYLESRILSAVLMVMLVMMLIVISFSYPAQAEWFDDTFKITHYNIAFENSFTGNFVTANGISGTYREDFLYSATGVCMQGTGQTRNGNFIRWDHGGYWVNKDGERTDPPDWNNGSPYWIGNPSDVWFATGGGGACGHGVTPGTSVAADLNVIPCSSEIYIVSIGFRTVDDKGPAIVGHKIDVLVPPSITDGHYRVYVFDTEPPNGVTNLISSSHNNAIGQWNDPQSKNKIVTLTWTDATDNVQAGLDANDVANGLDGYSIVWDHSPNTLPDKTKDIEDGAQSATSPPLSDGNDWYFHIRSVDNEVNVGGRVDERNWDDAAVHLGPFYIDTTNPGVGLASDPCVTGTATVYTTANDECGLDRVKVDIDGSVIYDGSTDPSSLDWDTTSYSDDLHTITLQAWDKAGNTNTASIEVGVDNTPPYDCEYVPEFPAGVTAVFGATFIIFLMMRRKHISK